MDVRVIVGGVFALSAGAAAFAFRPGDDDPRPIPSAPAVGTVSSKPVAPAASVKVAETPADFEDTAPPSVFDQIPIWIVKLLSDISLHASDDRYAETVELLRRSGGLSVQAWGNVRLVVGIEGLAKACLLLDQQPLDYPDVNRACRDGFTLLRSGGDPAEFQKVQAFARTSGEAVLAVAEAQASNEKYATAVVAYRASQAVVAAMEPSDTGLQDIWRHAAAVAGATALSRAPGSQDPERMKAFGAIGEGIAYDDAADILNTALAHEIAMR